MKFLARINVEDMVDGTDTWRDYCEADYPSTIQCFGVQGDGYDHWEVTAESEGEATSLVSSALADYPEAFMVGLEIKF